MLISEFYAEVKHDACCMTGCMQQCSGMLLAHVLHAESVSSCFLFAASSAETHTDLLNVKLALRISFPGGQVFFLSLQLLTLLQQAAVHVMLLLLHPF
jgi:hypothetical protein